MKNDQIIESIFKIAAFANMFFQFGYLTFNIENTSRVSYWIVFLLSVLLGLSAMPRKNPEPKFLITDKKSADIIIELYKDVIIEELGTEEGTKLLRKVATKARKTIEGKLDFLKL